MLDLLRSLEWCAMITVNRCTTVPGCPRCKAHRGTPHAPDCRLDRAIREMAEADPDGAHLREMAVALGWAVMTVAPNAPYREEDMRFRAGNGNFRTAADVRRAYAEVRALYHEHKAKQRDPVSEAYAEMEAQQRARDAASYPSEGEAIRLRWRAGKIAPEQPPTDPSALAAWLYARVVPGRTIAESPGRRFVVLAVDMSADGQRVFVDEANGYAIPRLRQAPITRLLNPDGTVLWEAT